MRSEPRHAPRVERLHAVFDSKPVKLRHRALCKLGEVIAKALDLHDERQTRALEQRQHVFELRNGLPRAVQRIVLQLVRAQVLQVPLSARHTLHVAVVEHGERPVAQQVYVKLRAKAPRDGVREGLHRIFRNARRLIVEPAVRIAEFPQCRHRLRPAPRAQ